MKILPLAILAALLSACREEHPTTDSAEQQLVVESAPRKEFVRIVDRNGKVYMFRPHMVTQIVSEENGCRIDVAGIGQIPMGLPIDEVAKLVNAK